MRIKAKLRNAKSSKVNDNAAAEVRRIVRAKISWSMISNKRAEMLSFTCIGLDIPSEVFNVVRDTLL